MFMLPHTYSRPCFWLTSVFARFYFRHFKFSSFFHDRDLRFIHRFWANLFFHTPCFVSAIYYSDIAHTLRLGGEGSTDQHSSSFCFYRHNSFTKLEIRDHAFSVAVIQIFVHHVWTRTSIQFITSTIVASRHNSGRDGRRQRGYCVVTLMILYLRFTSLFWHDQHEFCPQLLTLECIVSPPLQSPRFCFLMSLSFFLSYDDNQTHDEKPYRAIICALWRP